MPPKAAPRRPVTPGGNVNADTESAAPVPPSAAATSQSLLDPPGFDNDAAAQLRSRDTSVARAPVHRLQSLKKWTPEGNLIPLNPESSTPKPTLKWQPRAVPRRSQEERAARERLEEERRRERIAETTAA